MNYALNNALCVGSVLRLFLRICQFHGDVAVYFSKPIYNIYVLLCV